MSFEVSALEVLPPDNPWNTRVDDWTVAENSAAMIALIGKEKPLRGNDDMENIVINWPV